MGTSQISSSLGLAGAAPGAAEDTREHLGEHGAHPWAQAKLSPTTGQGSRTCPAASGAGSRVRGTGGIPQHFQQGCGGIHQANLTPTPLRSPQELWPFPRQFEPQVTLLQCHQPLGTVLRAHQVLFAVFGKIKGLLGLTPLWLSPAAPRHTQGTQNLGIKLL